MSKNKSAHTRYQTLDKCLRNFSKRYYFDDLLNAVNEVLFESNPNSMGIKVRQLRSDLSYMKSEAGFNAPIETIRDGKKAYYRYEDVNFSINKIPFRDDEIDKLQGAMQLLNRFKGAPQFEWLNQVSAVLEDKFGVQQGNDPVIGFDSSTDYSGYEHIGDIFKAIINKQVLKIDYQPFGKGVISYNFHPYYLKQYNNRWFVLGLNDETNVSTWTVPLDRIMKFEAVGVDYIQNETDWIDYFDEIIGVTRPYNKELEVVKLLFTPDQAPYVQTKPLHGLQRNKLTDDGLLVTLELIPNYELERLILSYGSTVKVIEPKELKEKIELELKKAYSKYT
ncbi:helix-turn-helix transcriptional regulator [Brumimicrobium salinarum]|nr:WYL domain-containing protein [Brumimicrobium salinarum]